MLLKVFGYRGIRYHGDRYYAREVDYWFKGAVLERVYSTLFSGVEPMDEEELLARVSKVAPRLSASDIRGCVIALKDTGCIRSTAGGLDVPAHRRPPMHLGYRILKAAGVPMHVDAIMQEMQAWYEKDRGKLTNGRASVIEQFRHSGLIVACGRTGFWALKEWGVMSARHLELIERVFAAKGLPMKPGALYQEIRMYRKDVRPGQIRYALANTGHFTKTGDGRYRPKEWDAA